jgi:D-alanyl-D-alanine carboxypeptidase
MTVLLQGHDACYKDLAWCCKIKSMQTWRMMPLSFKETITELHRLLGIPENYGVQRKLEMCEECTRLVSIGKDVFDRDQKMTPEAAHAWFIMRNQAATEGIDLQVVSAFRPVEYQVNIIQKKLNGGQSIEDILKVSAAPGYSEHHSGRALDLTTPDFEPLEEEFEKSPAFEWLAKTAGECGFIMSYPRNNCHGVNYEPWHWCWTG